MKTHCNLETTAVQETTPARAIAAKTRQAAADRADAPAPAHAAAQRDDDPDAETRDKRTPRELSHEELARCAGWLAREAGRQQGFIGRQWRAHWDDLHQTALLALLEQGDRPMGYAITAARNALRSYVWVHVKGLNGGWKSLASRSYTVIDTEESIDADEKGEDNLSWRLGPGRGRELVARPVEWAVVDRERSRAHARMRTQAAVQLRERGAGWCF